MNKIKKGELFGHLSGFLKSKGIELQKGSYTRRIQKGCTLLSDTINTSQNALARAKKEMDRGLQTMREVIRGKKSAKRPASTARSNPRPSRAKAQPAKASPRKPAKAKAKKR